MADSITWPQLVALMAFGPDGRPAETVRGVLHTRDVQPIDDDFDDDDFDDDAEIVVHPVLGRTVVTEWTARVARRGELLRVERPDGRPSMIFGADTVWTFGDGDVPEVQALPMLTFWWAGRELVVRPSYERWAGDDFTRLTGPIEATMFLGRPAWAFELAPPAHKPYPLQLVVDAESGLLLGQANRDFGSVAEWTEFEYGVDLPDVLFSWDGPVRAAPTHQEREAQHKVEMAGRRAWLRARGLGDIALPARTEATLHEWDDDTGAFHASLHQRARGSLLRRPRSSADWPDLDQLHWPVLHRWSDERWDWAIGTETALDDDELTALQDQLATST